MIILCIIFLNKTLGAFIACLNHFIRSRYVDGDRIADQWTWRATTLNPYYEGNDVFRMIPDDRFIR